MQITSVKRLKKSQNMKNNVFIQLFLHSLVVYSLVTFSCDNDFMILFYGGTGKMILSSLSCGWPDFLLIFDSQKCIKACGLTGTLSSVALLCFVPYSEILINPILSNSPQKREICMAYLSSYTPIMFSSIALIGENLHCD